MTQRVWNELEQLLKRKRMNDRALPTIVDAAFGYRIRRSHYMNAAEVSEQVASGDLKLLVDHGLLIGKGETRGRVYEVKFPTAGCPVFFSRAYSKAVLAYKS